METAESILVIITSSFLVLFLVLAIITLVLIIKLVKKIRKVVDRAEEVIDSAEAVTEVFRNVKGPLALAKLVRNIISLVNGRKK